MEVFYPIILFSIPIFLIVFIFAGYYYSGFEEFDKNSAEWRSPSTKLFITSGVFIIPILIFIASCYLPGILRGEKKGGWELEPKEYYENGGLAAMVCFGFVITSFISFIIFYDRKKRSRQAKVFLIMISILLSILSFITIIVDLDPTPLLK